VAVNGLQKVYFVPIEFSIYDSCPCEVETTFQKLTHVEIRLMVRMMRQGTVFVRALSMSGGFPDSLKAIV
jgi:hypothetical protein